MSVPERPTPLKTNGSAAPEPDWGLGDLLRFLWRHWLVMAVALAIGVVAGLYLQEVTTRTYESKARFIVNEIPVSLESKAMDAETDRQLVQTFILSIPNSDMLAQVEARVGSPPGQIVFEDIDKPLSLNGRQPRANVRIAAEKTSRIGTISVESQSAEFAAKVANAVLSELELRNIIAGQLKNVELKIKLAKTQADGVLQQLVTVSADRIKLEQQNNELDAYLKQNLAVENFPAFSDNPTLNNLKTQLMLIQSEVSSLSTVSTRGARLEGKKAELSGLRSQLSRESVALVTALRSKFEISKTSEKNQKDELNRLQAEISALENRGGALLKGMGDPSQIRREIQADGVSPDSMGSLIVVVEPASPERKPIRPKLWLNLALGLVLGGGLGLLAIILREALSNKIQEPEQLEAISGYQCLATLPKQPFFSRKLTKRQVFENPEPSPGLGFLRSFLLRPGRQQPVPKLVAFVPASPAADSSSAVADLAVLLAQAEKRTLVVDLNIENPRQATLLGTDPEKGLSAWLSSEESLDVAISYSTVRELAVLGPGVEIKNLDDLLSRRPLAPALYAALAQWDFILIDSPPLQSQWHLLLALPEAGSLFVTVEYGKTTIPEIRKIVHEAEMADWDLQGFVLENYPKRTR